MGKVYFISGHRDMSFKEWKKTYLETISKIITKEKNPKFVVGDCEGVDDISVRFLGSFDRTIVTQYHMCETPRYTTTDIKLVGGFTSDFDRDFNMTLNSDEDIAFVGKGRERSGTQQNIERRKWLKERKKKGLTYTQQDLLIRETGNFL